MVHIETLSNDVRTVITNATTLARDTKCDYVGTGHALLALYEYEECTASKILRSFTEINYEKEIADLRDSIKPHDEPAPDLKLSPALKSAIANAVSQARITNNKVIGTEHLLHGLITTPFITASVAFAETNKITTSRVRESLHSILS